LSDEASEHSAYTAANLHLVTSEIEWERDAFARQLRARNRSPKTIRSYTEAVDLLAEIHPRTGRPVDVEAIRRADVEAFITDQLERWTPSTAATRYRSLQQWFKFLVESEVIEHSPMAKMAPPKLDEAPVPILSGDELAALLATTSGAGFEQRRDHAL